MFSDASALRTRHQIVAAPFLRETEPEYINPTVNVKFQGVGCKRKDFVRGFGKSMARRLAGSYKAATDFTDFRGDLREFSEIYGCLEYFAGRTGLLAQQFLFVECDGLKGFLTRGLRLGVSALV